MSSKNSTDVLINGKIYTLSGYESTEYLQKVATYINSKTDEFMKNDWYRKLSLEDQKTLLEINIADDYFKAKKQADAIDGEAQVKDQRIYDIKHELIASQIDVEALKKEIATLQNELNESKMTIVRLETELSDLSASKRRRTTT
ncbi:MAG: cell division protein ZapA [Lachnospiraceae bacterium]|nr:cell division protein ZapA [Lachnospiraceae bacterium]